MAEAIETLDGWWMLHDLRRLVPGLGDDERQAATAAWEEFVRDVTPGPDGGWSAFYEVLGQKGDLLSIHVRPTPDDLLEVERAFGSTTLGEVTEPAYSYVSVVEISTYGAKGGELPASDPLADPYLRGRLHPSLPAGRWVSFYPMDKRRAATAEYNWYQVPLEERRRLMHEHGLIGRKYQGRVKQIISGSVGVDDYEWGVTLFADDPLDFKKIVYEMRFDEVSARFGEFGTFILGRRLDPAEGRSLFS